MISKTPYLIRQYYRHLIWNIPTESKELFLTFDDGPTPGVTENVLRILGEYEAKATFFCVGKNVEEHSEIYQKILKDGHSVGNHTQDHINGWKNKDEKYIQNVEDCNAVFKSDLFRPPYGKIRKSQASKLLPSYQIIMWSLLTRDYDLKLKKEDCLELALSGLKAGSILVFHDSLKAKDKMLYVLEELLVEMKNRGFSSSKITSDLLERSKSAG